jgi:hypothetical protein
MFSTQDQIDNFQTDYPGCTQIEGNVTITGDNINNITGLSVIISIEGTLDIFDNPSLTSLSGLSALTLIGENLIIGDYEFGGNSVLQDLTGLNAVSSIGGSLSILSNDALISLAGLNNVTFINGSLYIRYNDALESLSGLDALTSIWGNLLIEFNPVLTDISELNTLTSIYGNISIKFNSLLTSLTGLDNIEDIITNLEIYHNNFLSICAVKSICDYLADPNSNVSISVNAAGCNSNEEVEEACGIIGIDEPISGEGFTVYPNPSSDLVMFNFSLMEPSEIKLAILNNMGQAVAVMDKSFPEGEQQVIWNTEGLPAGLYFYRLIANGEQRTANGKLMVVR